MRYIDLGELEETENWPPGNSAYLTLHNLTPEQWRAHRDRAEGELRNLAPGQTYSDIFKKYSYLWSAVKECYRGTSHEKCWYCETKTGRIRGDIDHYRPKGKVTENPAHPGYWWLAFDWRNWRFSCELCNSKLMDLATGDVGGKGSDFPLVGGDESHRICIECDFEDLMAEDPALLDPTNSQDVDLLTFTRDGRAGPITDDEQSVDYQRVQSSITAYHLDHSKLVKERKTLYYKVQKFVTMYRKFDAMWRANRSDHGARACAKEAFDNLHELISPRKEYSAAARAYLSMHRKDDPEWRWVDRLLTAS